MQHGTQPVSQIKHPGPWVAGMQTSPPPQPCSHARHYRDGCMELWGKSCLELLGKRELIPARPRKLQEPPEPWLSLFSFLPLAWFTCLFTCPAHLSGWDDGPAVLWRYGSPGPGLGWGVVRSKVEARECPGYRGERWTVTGSLTRDLDYLPGGRVLAEPERSLTGVGKGSSCS